MSNQNQTRRAAHDSHASKRGRSRSMNALGLVLVLGMLFWARLLIIADLPRMAIASDPDEATPVPAAEHDDHSGDDAHDGAAIRPDSEDPAPKN